MHPRIRPVLALVALACHSEATPAIKVDMIGPPAFDLKFQPETAFAEYVELPGDHNELRITLASYLTTCEEFIAPPPNGAFLSVVILMPPDALPEAKAYPYLDAEHAPARSGVPVSESFSIPFLRTDQRDLPVPAGGSVQLSRVSVERGASVTGTLSYEFPGDPEHGASAITGQFSAEICRSNRAELRALPKTQE